MASSRWVISNQLETATLKNGTGGGAPARDEVAPYVMEHVQNTERLVKWQATGAGDIDVDFDLGSAKQVIYAGILGHVGVGGLGSLSCTVSYGAAYLTWDGNATVLSLIGGQDVGAIFAAINKRYWRFSFTFVGSSFTVGRIVIATAITDLGLLFSSARETLRIPSVVERTIGDQPRITRLGVIKKTMELQFSNIDGTALGKLIGVTLGKSAIYVDRFDASNEVVFPEAGVSYLLKFASGTAYLYDATLIMEELKG